ASPRWSPATPRRPRWPTTTSSAGAPGSAPNVSPEPGAAVLQPVPLLVDEAFGQGRGLRSRLGDPDFNEDVTPICNALRGERAVLLLLSATEDHRAAIGPQDRGPSGAFGIPGVRHGADIVLVEAVCIICGVESLKADLDDVLRRILPDRGRAILETS